MAKKKLNLLGYKIIGWASAAMGALAFLAIMLEPVNPDTTVGIFGSILIGTPGIALLVLTHKID